MKTVLIIIGIWIVVVSIAKMNQKKKSKEAYKKYLESLDKLNAVCSRFGIAPQEPGRSYVRVQTELKEKQKQISDLIDAGELTNFRSKQDLNESFHEGMDLIDESIDLFVVWENISNPV